VAEPSPTVRQRRLVAELRRLREGSGKTIDDVAQEIGVSKSTLSRIENGQVTPKLPVLRALIAAYAVTEPAAARLEQLRQDAAKRGWWASVTEPSEVFQTLIGLEAEALWVNVYSSVLIPGLLQTEAYARAILGAVRFDLSPDEVEQWVKIRLRRQERISHFRLSVIVGEEALDRAIGGREVMRAQIEHLLALSQERDIELQLVAKEYGEHVGLDGRFQIIGLEPSKPEAVYLEGARWETLVEEAGELVAFSQAFEKLRALALSPRDSAARLRDIQKG
jgi:transcriptional regulator with XRE-family HTH domain